MRARCSSTLVFAAALLAVGIAHAAADAVPPALRACANVKRNSERLACYDQAIERLSSDSVSTDGAAERSAEASFGASSVRSEEPVRTLAREELTSVSAHVTALSRDAAGALLINLEHAAAGSRSRNHDYARGTELVSPFDAQRPRPESQARAVGF